MDTHLFKASKHSSYGAVWNKQAGGTYFRTFSGVEATSAALRLYDARGGLLQTVELARDHRFERTSHLTEWHAFVPGIEPGTKYAFGVDGPNSPEKGFRYDFSKDAIDPAASALSGHMSWDPYSPPKAVVVDHSFDWGDGQVRVCGKPEDLVIYEAHVRGMTALCPHLAPELRGTYLGMCSEPVIERLKRLHVTHVELMPVHHCLSWGYWNYNPIAWGAPETRYVCGPNRLDAVMQMKQMVKVLGQEGIGVILDVVFNHTDEGDHRGPAVSLKLLDNWCYFLDDSRYYSNRTGCGNTVNCAHPAMVRLILQLLRRWVLDYHVAGFRFDLAGDVFSAANGYSLYHPLLTGILTDPILQHCVLIGEPWSALGGGACYAALPAPFLSWSDGYKLAMRRFLCGTPGSFADFAHALDGAQAAEDPVLRYRRVSYLTCHDGFTLHDLLYYNGDERMNSTDGEQNNCSWNCCFPGEQKSDPQVVARRAVIQRASFALQACTAGATMLLYGNEELRTAHGHNNPYNLGDDFNAMAWNDSCPLFAVAERLLELRRRLPGLRSHLQARPRDTLFGRAYGWYTPEGVRAVDLAWSCPGLLAGALYIPNTDRLSSPPDSSLLLFVNGFQWDISFLWPRAADEEGCAWRRLFSSDADDPFAEYVADGKEVFLGAKGVALFQSAR